MAGFDAFAAWVRSAAILSRFSGSTYACATKACCSADGTSDTRSAEDIGSSTGDLSEQSTASPCATNNDGTLVGSKNGILSGLQGLFGLTVVK
jgi:hypothetical protein